MKQTKEQYVSPQIEVIELENEGVIASNIDPMPVNPWSSTSSTSNYSATRSASGGDLEDMINDILTVGE